MILNHKDLYYHFYLWMVPRIHEREISKMQLKSIGINMIPNEASAKAY